MDKDLKRLILELEETKKENIIYLETQVDTIIKNNIRNNKTIELTLDSILDLCDIKEATVLFNKLCNYYKLFDIEGATDYFNIYKEMYEEDSNIKSI